MSRGPPTLCIKLDEETLERIKSLAEERGVHPSELAAELLYEALEQESRAAPDTAREEIRRTAAQLTRKVQDLLVPYTGKLDELQRTLAQVSEKLEQLGEEIAKLQERAQSPPPRPPATQTTSPEARAPPSYRRAPPGRPTAMERLRQQGAVFQSDLKWLNNPPAFFEKLRREGAVVMQLGGEYVAVDPEYWAKMERTLAQVAEEDPEEAARKLPRPMDRLFRLLYENERAYYDSIEKGWKIIPPEE